MRELVPENFPEIYDLERLKNLPRYLKALELRAQRGSLNLAVARKKLQEVSRYNDRLREMKETILPETSESKKKKIDEFFWMIEEYKVSLFAQELKTPFPVSAKKIQKIIEEVEGSV